MTNKPAKISEKERYRLKRFIKDLESHRGRGTELVSVYVPAGYDINKISTHIAQEQGTASNIKSKQTRDNVISALEKILQHLKLFPHTPPNGLVLFAGNVAEREGQQDYQVWSIEPPTPLNQRLYRCDKEFVLDPLLDMVDDKDSFGMIVMDRREGNIALLKGKTIVPLITTESAVPGKFKAGGQSAQRFARNRELAAKDFYQKIGDLAKDQFTEMKDLKGILVGGPGHTKYEFVDGNFLPTPLKEKIIGIRDLSYTGDFGLQELLERSEDILSEESVVEEKKLVNRFFNYLAKEPGMVTYGKDDCLRLLRLGAVDILLISETISDDVVDMFMKEAEPLGSSIEIISTETREGNQLKEMGGIVAILRYNAGESFT